MKKIVFSFLFISFSFSLPFSFPSWLSNNRPDWIKTHGNYSFVGISSPKDNKQEAIKNATINALEQVSNRLGVVVNSDFSSSKSITNNEISNNTKSNITLRSFSRIENYEIKDNHCETNDDDKFVCYVLLSFERQQFIELQQKTTKRIKKLNNLISKLETAIENSNYNEARSLYQQASLIPESNYNPRFQTLKNKFNKMINIKISNINKEISPLEDIKFSLFSNQSGFLYVIYDNGYREKLIFPKRFEDNKIQKNNSFKISTSAHFNNNYNQKLMIIFSKNKLNIPINSDNTIDSSQNSWKDVLETQKNNLSAVVKKFQFTLRKISTNLCIKSNNDVISKVLLDKTKRVFRNLGVHVNCNYYTYLIRININKNRFYSPEMDSYFYKLKFNFILEKNYEGEINNVYSEQTFKLVSNKIIANTLNQDNLNKFSQEFKLNNLYKSIINNQNSTQRSLNR